MDRVSNIKITNTFFLFASGVIRSWQRNRAQIARITFVNLLVALLGELLVRKALVSISWLPANETVFYSGKLHTQVSINLLMTFLLVFFGSVVYFFESRVARYVFFISFALFNSILAQGFLALFSKLDATYFSRRLIFDFVYSASLKFGSFEFIRKLFIAFFIISKNDFDQKCSRRFYDNHQGQGLVFVWSNFIVKGNFVRFITCFSLLLLSFLVYMRPRPIRILKLLIRLPILWGQVEMVLILIPVGNRCVRSSMAVTFTDDVVSQIADAVCSMITTNQYYS